MRNENSSVAKLHTTAEPGPPTEAEPESEIQREAGPGHLAHIFCSLEAHRFTGIVQVALGRTRALFSLRQGRPVFVEESTLGDSLPRLLVQQGLITERQYAEVVRRMTDCLVDSEEMGFCDVAVDMGFLTSEEALGAIRQRVRAKVIEAMGWKGCEVTVDEIAVAEEDCALDGPPGSPGTLGPLVYAGIRALFDKDAIAPCLRGLSGHYPRLRMSVASIVRRFELDAEEAKVVARCDGTHTASDIVASAQVRRLHAWQLMCLLRLSEVAEFLETPASATPASPKNPEPVAAGESRPAALRGSKPASSAEVMPSPPGGSKPAASTEAKPRPNARPTPRTQAETAHLIRKRTRRRLQGLMKAGGQFRASDSSQPKREQDRSAAEALRRRMRDPSLPQEVPSAEERAESAWQSGKRHLRAQHFRAAEETFKTACELKPDEPAYRMYYLWAARCSCADPDAHSDVDDELNDLARSLTCQDGHSAFAYYVLGRLHLAGGKDRKALDCFAKAVAQDRGLEDAQRHYRILSHRVGKR